MSDERRDGLAATVLERMSQDSGPADCEPFTGWCVDLARQVLALQDVLTQHEEALRGLQTLSEGRTYHGFRYGADGTGIYFGGGLMTDVASKSDLAFACAAANYVEDLIAARAALEAR